MVPAEPKRLMIEHTTFAEGHTLSFSQQPFLKDLFLHARDTEQPLTIVVGAGVSMNAGLRSWKELIECMVDQIKDKRLREMARSDPSDLMRKAELIVQLIKKHAQKSDSEIIRAALYPRDSTANTGGQLAASIARLVAVRENKNIRLLTTNFDTVLEGALSRYFPTAEIKAFPLLDADAWRKWQKDGRVGVLHVHGVVQQPGQGRSKKPIVLAESQFFQYGAKVRSEIHESLRGACSLFVGLSMSDPNLVGPAYEMKDEPEPRFSLLVPEGLPGIDDSMEAAKYAFESAAFMERALRLRTIFTKSYSQLNQVLSDLSLAFREPDRYDPDGTGLSRSLVYGDRIAKALNDCYAAIGCNDLEQIPVDNAAADLNRRLYEALHASGGPISVLQGFASSIGGQSIGGTYDENFAIYLWLRCRDEQRSGAASYALNLAGTSAYTHRESWSGRREVEITRDAKVAAVNAVFRGAPLAVNTNPSFEPPVWRGILALPIVREFSGSTAVISGMPIDTLTVGALTLNSTRLVRRSTRMSASESAQDFSIMATLDTEQMNQVVESMRLTAARLLQQAPKNVHSTAEQIP